VGGRGRFSSQAAWGGGEYCPLDKGRRSPGVVFGVVNLNKWISERRTLPLYGVGGGGLPDGVRGTVFKGQGGGKSPHQNLPGFPYTPMAPQEKTR